MTAVYSRQQNFCMHTIVRLRKRLSTFNERSDFAIPGTHLIVIYQVDPFNPRKLTE